DCLLQLRSHYQLLRKLHLLAHFNCHHSSPLKPELVTEIDFPCFSAVCNLLRSTTFQELSGIYDISLITDTESLAHIMVLYKYTYIFCLQLSYYVLDINYRNRIDT